jgi:hypothetical protein
LGVNGNQIQSQFKQSDDNSFRVALRRMGKLSDLSILEKQLSIFPFYCQNSYKVQVI